MRREDVYGSKLEAALFGQGKEAPTVISGTFPVVIHAYGWDEEVTVKDFGTTGFIQICSGKKKRVPRGRRLHDRALRDAFEQVDTPAKLGQFLRLCGPFCESSPAGKTSQQVILWDEFLAWQQFMRDLQLQETPTVQIEVPLARVLTDTLSDLTILRWAAPVRWSNGPSVEAFARTAVEVVASTIAADILNRAKLRTCDRGACKRLFVVESRHDERDNNYCSDRCRKLNHQATARPPKKEVGNGKA